MAKSPLSGESDDRRSQMSVEWRDEILRRMLHTPPQPLKPASTGQTHERVSDSRPGTARRSTDEIVDADGE